MRLKKTFRSRGCRLAVIEEVAEVVMEREALGPACRTHFVPPHEAQEVRLITADRASSRLLTRPGLAYIRQFAARSREFVGMEFHPSLDIPQLPGNPDRGQ